MKKKIPLIIYSCIGFLIYACSPVSNVPGNKQLIELNQKNYDLHQVLKTLGIKNQPAGSKVCWAVCFANIHNGIYPEKKLTYCEILGSKGENCINQQEGFQLESIKEDYDHHLKPEHIIDTANKYDLPLEKFEVADLKDFDKVVSFIKTKKVPIIFLEEHGTLTHLQYIFGFERTGNCEYYSIFDPLPGNEIHLYKKLFDTSIDEGRIIASWYPKIPKDSNRITLEYYKSDVLEEISIQIAKFYQRNPEYATSEKRNVVFDDPRHYLSLPKLDLEMLKSPDWLSNYKEKVIVHMEEFCFPNYPYRFTNTSNIQNMMKALYTNKNLEYLLPSSNEYEIENSQLEVSFDHKKRKTLYTIKENDEPIAKRAKFNAEKIQSEIKAIQQKQN